jgi:L-ascorbate metabolism protein UlaG (beta-lactamase superfamily)
MLLRRLDDYQSWQVQYSGSSVLIDPWLTEHPISGAFDRRHGTGFTTHADLVRENAEIAAVLLCTSVDDHLRPESLQLLADVPVHSNLKAAKAARATGCTDTNVHAPGASFDIPCREGGMLRVTATKCGLPLGLIATGWVIEALDDDGNDHGRVWIEPHQPTIDVARGVAERGPVDVAVLPTQSVLAVVLPVTAGPKRSALAARACRARALVPTATDPRRDMRWWQKAIYVVAGGDDRTRRELRGGAELIPLRTGDWLDVRSGR